VKIKISKKTILQTVAFIWTIVVLAIFWLNINKDVTNCDLKQGCFSFFGHNWQVTLQNGHSFYIDVLTSVTNSILQKPHVPAPAFLIFGVILFIYLADFLYDRFVEKKKELNFKITPFALILIFTGIFALCFNRWEAFFFINKPIFHQSIWLRYPLIVIKSLALILVVLAMGLKLKNYFLKEPIKDDGDNVTRNFILSFSFGLIAIIFPLYFLALFKILLFKYIIALLIIFLVIAYKEVYYWIKIFFTKRFEFKGSFLDPSIFLLLISLVFMANNLIELIRPYPMGFDDLNVYINNPGLMAKSGALISGAISYYWELFLSLGFILYKQTEMAMVLSFFGGLVTYIAIYYIVKIYCREKGLSDRIQRIYASLSATLFYTFPSIVFQSSKDIKVDMASIAVTLAAFILFWEWRKNVLQSKTGQKYFKLLAVTAFLSGFAFAIKYTSGLFIAVLLLYTFWTLCEAKWTIFKSIVVCVYFGLISLLPVMPVTLRNVFQTNSIEVASLRFGDQSSQEIKIDPPFDTTDSIVDQHQYLREKATGPREELGRYTGFDNFWKKYLKLPIGMLQNKFIAGSFVDMGYVIPVFVPLVILFIIKGRKKRVSTVNNIFQLAVLTLSFWLLWMFTASGVVWYGYSGLIFLLLLFVEVNIQIRQYFSKWFIFYTNALIVIWLIFAICMRLGFLVNIGLGIEQVGFMYARGQTTKEEYRFLKFDPYLSIIDNINIEIKANPDNPPKTYMIGSFYRYFFEENDKSVIFDHIFDIFMFLNQDQNQQKSLQRMKNSGVKYILFDRSMGGLDQTPDRSIIKKYDAFVEFINGNLDSFELLSDPKDQRYLFVKIK